VRRLLLGLFHATEAWRIPEEEVDRLRRDFPDLEVGRAQSKEELAEKIPEAEILFSWAPGDAAVARGKRLRWIHAPAAGVGTFITPSVLERGILLTNSRGVHAVPIAEHTMGVLVALARQLDRAVADQIQRRLDRERWWVGSGRPQELHGRTLGLFGYGAIGREIARRALSFGMRVVAVRRNPISPPAWEPDLLAALGLPAEEPRIQGVMGPGELGSMLGESDAVVVAAALTPETEGIFDAAAFRRMKRGAWFVNIARGKIVRERDLVEALREGQVGGAALDVFETEPLPQESELYNVGSVILTPHISGGSTGFWPRAMRLFRENLRRDGTGLPLLNRVDLTRGY
jgi:phosphoglycerate dehydrogenase-like enzyme